MADHMWKKEDLDKVAYMMRDVGDTSRMALIHYMGNNPGMSFTHLLEHAPLGPYNKNMLGSNMRILGKSGIVEKNGKVYSLTVFGRQLYRVLDEVFNPERTLEENLLRMLKTHIDG